MVRKRGACFAARLFQTIDTPESLSAWTMTSRGRRVQHGPYQPSPRLKSSTASNSEEGHIQNPPLHALCLPLVPTPSLAHRQHTSTTQTGHKIRIHFPTCLPHAPLIPIISQNINRLLPLPSQRTIATPIQTQIQTKQKRQTCLVCSWDPHGLSLFSNTHFHLRMRPKKSNTSRHTVQHGTPKSRRHRAALTPPRSRGDLYLSSRYPHGSPNLDTHPAWYTCRSALRLLCFCFFVVVSLANQDANTTPPPPPIHPKVPLLYTAFNLDPHVKIVLLIRPSSELTHQRGCVSSSKRYHVYGHVIKRRPSSKIPFLLLFRPIFVFCLRHHRHPPAPAS